MYSSTIIVYTCFLYTHTHNIEYTSSAIDHGHNLDFSTIASSTPPSLVFHSKGIICWQKCTCSNLCDKLYTRSSLWYHKAELAILSQCKHRARHGKTGSSNNLLPTGYCSFHIFLWATIPLPFDPSTLPKPNHGPRHARLLIGNGWQAG